MHWLHVHWLLVLILYSYMYRYRYCRSCIYSILYHEVGEKFRFFAIIQDTGGTFLNSVLKYSIVQCRSTVFEYQHIAELCSVQLLLHLQSSGGTHTCYSCTTDCLSALMQSPKRLVFIPTTRLVPWLWLVEYTSYLILVISY